MLPTLIDRPDLFHGFFRYTDGLTRTSDSMFAIAIHPTLDAVGGHIDVYISVSIFECRDSVAEQLCASTVTLAR
jgi:hypothetical protein